MVDTSNHTTLSAGITAHALFEAHGISKSFGDVAANKDISISVRQGEILALLGENGAGKSTFVKMTDGVLKPDAGSFLWNGEPVAITSPGVARRIGIGMIFQHFSSFEALTVLENLALALPERSIAQIRREITAISGKYKLAIKLKSRVEQLSAGEKQRVEIVRALLQDPKLLILDEPTSVLTPQEADRLFDILKTLANDGMAMIYISHRLKEIRKLCDRATILRNGQVSGHCNPRTTSVTEIAGMMIGKAADPIQRSTTYTGGPRLVVDDLSLRNKDGVSLKNINFSARRGEIMGIAGIAGEGQDLLFAALSGERRVMRPDSVRVDDIPVCGMGPTARRRRGLAFAPEQRIGHSAVSEFSLPQNLRLTRHGMDGTSFKELRARSEIICEEYDVRSVGKAPKAGTLSGGNLQKFVIGRELDREPDVFIVAQPTWGVDAGAAAFIRNRLLSVAQRGGAVVLISQDLDEIFQIADRVAVLHRGELSDTYNTADISPEQIGLLMAGEDTTDEHRSPDNDPQKDAGDNPREPSIGVPLAQRETVRQPTMFQSGHDTPDRTRTKPDTSGFPDKTSAQTISGSAAASAAMPFSVSVTNTSISPSAFKLGHESAQKNVVDAAESIATANLSLSGSTTVPWTARENYHHVGKPS